jgi:hypothetical protein
MDDESKTICAPTGETIKYFRPTYEYYLDRTTIIIGASGSGKSTVIEEILYLCKDYIPNYFVVAPVTSMASYEKVLPKKCIKENLSKEKIETIWRRQYNFTMIYNKANDEKVLNKLFERIRDSQAVTNIGLIKRATDQIVKRHMEKTEIPFDVRNAECNKIKQTCEAKIKAIQKTSIRNHNTYLQGIRDNLDKEEIIALDYLDINPRLLLIIDDKTEEIETWMKYFKSGKGDSNPFESIFYRGRHNYITLIIAVHDDKVIKPGLRKNARVTYYTDSQGLFSALSRATNGFSTQQKKYLQNIAQVIYDDEDSKIKTYKKLCFLRGEMSPFRYMIANKYDKISVGCAPLYELIKALPAKEDQEIDNNPYLQKEDEKKAPKKKRWA